MSAEIDPWRMFSEMCRLVTENENVILTVTIMPNGFIEMCMEHLDDEGGEDFD